MTCSPRTPARGLSLVPLLVFAAAVLALAVFPSFVKKPYVLHMGVMLFLAVIQGQAWNVVGGYAGQYSVGHAAYFGVGAYATMMLLEVNHIPPWWGVWGAMAAAVLLSVLIGAITFRLRGANFAVEHSKLGYYFQAIREDQDAAHSLGINLTFYKSVALAISAALTAAAGGFFAMFVKFIDPNIAFGLDVSVQIVLICIVGGIETILGPVLGAAVLVPLSEILQNPRGLVQVGVVSPDSGVVRFIETYLSNAHLLVYGILVVVVILFAPEGVLGVIRRLLARSRRRREASARRSAG